MTVPWKPVGYESYRSVSELAKYVGVSVRTIERWHNQGKLPPPTRVGDNGMKLWTPGQADTVLQFRLQQLPSAREERCRIT